MKNFQLWSEKLKKLISFTVVNNNTVNVGEVTPRGVVRECNMRTEDARDMWKLLCREGYVQVKR